MAIDRITPIDELSGLPLPIIPTENLASHLNINEANWHHHFHPESNKILNKSLGGVALRHCRKQLINARYHNMGKESYHSLFIGPPIPEDPRDQFSLVVLACAGLVPSQAIETVSGDYNIVELEPNQKKAIQRKRKKSKNEYMYFRYGYEPVRNFLKNYTINQDISTIDESKIEEFLKTKDIKTRNSLGRFLLRQVSQIACDKVDNQYKLFRNIGLLHPDMPKDSFVFVEAAMGDVEKRADLLPEIRERLENHYSIKRVA